MTESKERELLFDHDFDGIRELDNRLPPWWLYLFYITIAWAILYLLYYHVLDLGDSQAEEYLKEMNPGYTEVGEKSGFSIGYHSPFYSAEGDDTPLRKMELHQEKEKQAALGQSQYKRSGGKIESANFDELILTAMEMATPENLEKLKVAFPDLYLTYQSRPGQPLSVAEPTAGKAIETAIEIQALTDGASLTAGKKIFETNCITCHGKAGEGGIGPNLTDDFYLHGPGMTNAYKTITNGFAAKGMISWRGILKDDQIKQVASYIISIHGTHPPNPKAPQGEKDNSVQ